MGVVLNVMGASIAVAQDRLSVAVSILPAKYFVERIGGDKVDVFAVIPPGSNPVSYEPKPKQVARLSKTPLYLSMGVPFERVWLQKLTQINASIEVVDATQGMIRRTMVAHHHEGETAEEHAQHVDEQARDPHLWVSPPHVRLIANTIRDQLVQQMPAFADDFRRNHAAFVKEINQLDDEFNALFSTQKGPRSFMVFHPAWGYFADTYGLTQVPIELEGKEPGPRELAALILQAKQQGVKTIFVQPEFARKQAEIIAQEIGAEVVRTSVLVEDWLGNLRTVGAAFAASMEQ